MGVLIREWLRQAPFTLALSAGYFGFFAHAGALGVLESEGLRPAKVTGASAGALVGGLWAAGVSAGQIQDTLLRVRRADFWDPGLGLGLLRGARFAKLLDPLISNVTFDQCPVPLAISVFRLRTRQTEVMTTGRVADAIRASCGLPILFHPILLDGKRYADGGIIDRPGVGGARNDARVLLHYLPSKSPWRRFYGPAQVPPRREGHVVLAPEGLPRSGPFALHLGERAMRVGAQSMQRALDAPVPV